MSDLKNIGFYTLSDERVLNVSASSPLQRCELLITDACNFKCPYCRGCAPEYRGTLDLLDAYTTLKLWCDQGLKNVRFSGGEPTLHPKLDWMVQYCKGRGVEHIAISTNGSSPRSVYKSLLEAGANDFSISLDACCAEVGDNMAGGVKGSWDTVVDNIRFLASKTYVTVGVVLTDTNVQQMVDTVKFAHAVGVSDIRIISAAQSDINIANAVSQIPQGLLDRHPILKYRVEHLTEKRDVRGISDTDTNRCALVLDDMAVLGGKHFPCIIYLRERGQPIGNIDSGNVRQEREYWAFTHDTHADPICKKNCLDVCVDYNNKYRELHNGV